MVTNHSCKTFGGETFGDEFVILQFSSLHNRSTINFLFFEPSVDQTLGPLKTRAATQSHGELHFYIKLDVT